MYIQLLNENVFCVLDVDENSTKNVSSFGRFDGLKPISMIFDHLLLLEIPYEGVMLYYAKETRCYVSYWIYIIIDVRGK